MTNLKNISDTELFIRCKNFGKDVLRARQIFGGLLPEVCKRRLYEKKGFHTIYEFAAKLAGLTHDQVDTYIRLERKYEDKPVLHSALVDGQISINKLVRIASIATVENQSELFEVAQKLSKAAIDVYVKDYKIELAGGLGGAVRAGETGRAGGGSKIQNGLFPTENTPKTLPVQGGEAIHGSVRDPGASVAGVRAAATSVAGFSDAGANATGAISPNIDFEIIAALSPELKQKIKALIDKGINVDELFMQLLETRESEIEQKKVEIGEELEQKCREQKQCSHIGEHDAGRDAEYFVAGATRMATRHPLSKPATRHIPAVVKKIITLEFGKKCSRHNCRKPAENLHHQKRFAIFKSHDPRFIKPLCKGHHELEHSGDQMYRRYRLAATG
jgi:hypothetical protein